MRPFGRITWRSWLDGGKTGGPIASAWNVRGWPILYVIDVLVQAAGAGSAIKK